MNGTMTWVTLAMRVTPPKMIIAVSPAMMTATMALRVVESLLNEPPTASTMELVWMAL